MFFFIFLNVLATKSNQFYSILIMRNLRKFRVHIYIYIYVNKINVVSTVCHKVSLFVISVKSLKLLPHIQSLHGHNPIPIQGVPINNPLATEVLHQKIDPTPFKYLSQIYNIFSVDEIFPLGCSPGVE